MAREGSFSWLCFLFVLQASRSGVDLIQEVIPMKKCTFQRCFRAVGSMTSAQRHDLKAAIERRDKKDLVAEVVSLVGTPTACPYCHHPEIRPWGQAAGLPRFRCRGCKRTFNALTDTPLAGLHHKDRWLFFLESSTKGSRSGRRPDDAGSTRKQPFCGDTDSWPCPPISRPGRKAASSKPTRPGF